MQLPLYAIVSRTCLSLTDGARDRQLVCGGGDSCMSNQTLKCMQRTCICGCEDTGGTHLQVNAHAQYVCEDGYVTVCESE